MNIPMAAFGNGFVNARNRRINASTKLYQVNVSNGMPIISDKKTLVEKTFSAVQKKKKAT